MPAEVPEAGQMVHELGRQRGVAAGPVELASAIHGEGGGRALDHRHADTFQPDVCGIPVAGVFLKHHPPAERPLGHPVGTV